jgi:hypothetical protein
MNAQLQEPGTALTVTERATHALATVANSEKLKALAKSSERIIVLTNQAGRDECHGALMTLKATRILIQKTGKESREDAQKFSKAVIAEEGRLISIIEPEESRLQALRDDWDTAEEKAKALRIQQEIERVAGIQSRIADLRGAVGVIERHRLTSAQISEHIADLQSEVIDESYAEFQTQADDAKTATLSRLAELKHQAEEREAEAEKLRLERIELDRLREEKRVRDEQAAAEKAEADRIARVAREAEEAKERERLTEANRLESERLAKERDRIAEEERVSRKAREAAENEARKLREAAEADLAERQRVQKAEEAKLAAQRAELLKQQEASKPKPVEMRTVSRPSAAQMISVLSGFFSVSPAAVLIWVREADWELAE